jgi:kumamolisin
MIAHIPNTVARVARGLAALSMIALSTTALASGKLATPDATAGATLLGRTAADTKVTLALHLPSRDPAGLASFLAHVTRRGDALYRHYLTPEEFAARFGASQADYDATIAWAQAHGLTVGERHTSRTIVAVSGPAHAIEAALGTSFSDYRDATGRTFYAAPANLSLPSDIAGKVRGVVGLSGRTRFATLARRLPAGVKTLGYGHGPGGGFSASDLRSIYSVPAQNFGPKQTLAVFEQGGFDPNDVTTYLVKNNLPMVPVKVRNVDGYDGSVNDPNVEAEAVLDIDMQIAINPAAAEIRVYEQGTESFDVALVDSLSAMANDNTAKSISISYGTDESIQGADAIDAENTVLEQMTAQGQAVFASSGDQGAYGRSGGSLNVEDPGSQPFVTSVGGTTVFPGKHETYNVEEVWNDLFSGYGATGGGISTVWPIPGWQQPGGYSVTVRNGGSSTMRNVPDVASVANPLTGVSIYSAINGGWFPIGGTSVSAPIWAGFYSLVDAASEGFGMGSAGFANPGIYDIATFRGIVYTTTNDVTDGNNGVPAAYGTPGFFAGPGYDNTTGWGSFIGSALLVDFILPPANGTDPLPPAPTQIQASATSTTITLTWAGAKMDHGYYVFANQNSTTNTVANLLEKKPAATITGLTPNTQYYVVVYAVAKGGQTPAEPIIVTTAKKNS